MKHVLFSNGSCIDGISVVNK